MASVKCVGTMAAAGALVAGGFNLYKGLKARKHVVNSAEKMANIHGGKIPTGGMTPDGKLWDGFTTVEQVKKETKKAVAIRTTLSSVFGAVMAGVCAAGTLFLKKHI